MTKEKKAKLEEAGFVVTSATNWLGLTDEESKIVEMRVALAKEIEKLRVEQGLTQAALAKRLNTKQSGVARMINNPDSSTIDNLMKTMIAMGAPVSRIAATLLLCAAAN